MTRSHMPLAILASVIVMLALAPVAARSSRGAEVRYVSYLPAVRTARPTWVISLNSPGLDRPVDIRGVTQLADGRLIGVGVVEPPSEDDDGVVAWLTADGHVTALRRLGFESDIYNDQLLDVIATDDGGLLMTGITGPPDRAWLVKLDAAGRIAWQFRVDGQDWVFDIGHMAVELPNGGYAVMGRTSTYATGRGYDLWLLRLSEDGALLWQKAYHYGLNDDPAGLAVTADGGLLVAAENDADENPALAKSSWVMRVDAEGALLWSKVYQGVYFSDAAPAPGGGLVVVGWLSDEVGRQGWVARLNADGDILWQKRYGHESGDFNTYWLFTVAATAGGFVVGGTTDSQSAPGDAWPSRMWLLLLSADGNIVRQRTYDGYGATSISAVQPLPDGYFFRGFVNANPDYSTQLMKTDLAGGIAACDLVGDSAAVITGTTVAPRNVAITAADTHTRLVATVMALIDLEPTTATLCPAAPALCRGE